MTIPAHLASESAQGLKQGEPLAQWEIGSARNFVYAIIDWQAREAAIVDSHRGMSPVLNELRANGIRAKRILLTHTHWDHILGLPELLTSHPELKLHVHELDLHRLEHPVRSHPGLSPIRDRERIRIGSIEVEALHTPGHSAGEISYFVRTAPPYLLSGDTIFIQDCGRTDFEDGSNEQMFSSLQRIRSLPPETILLPGHHYRAECSSTLEREFRESPPFQCRSAAELAALP